MSNVEFNIAQINTGNLLESNGVGLVIWFQGCLGNKSCKSI